MISTTYLFDEFLYRHTFKLHDSLTQVLPLAEHAQVPLNLVVAVIPGKRSGYRGYFQIRNIDPIQAGERIVGSDLHIAPALREDKIHILV